MPRTGNGRRVGSGPDAVQDVGIGLRSDLCGCDEAGQIAGGLVREAVGLALRLTDHREIATPNDVVDHALQAHFPAIVRVVDALNAVVMQLGDFFGKNGAAATAEDADVTRSSLVEEVLHVLEVLHVPALIGGHGDGLGVFLDRAVHHLVHRPVVPEVDDLTTRTLQDAAHDVDGGIVAVEEGGCRDDADRVP